MSRLSYLLKVIFLLALVGCAQEPSAATPTTVPASATVPASPQATLVPTTAATRTPGATATGEAEGVGLRLVAEGLTAPLSLVAPPDGGGRRFIVDQIGLIRILDAEGELLETPFLDLQAELVELNATYDERGLLSLAFHPNYAENGRFFVYYAAPLREEAPEGWDNTTYLSEFTVSEDDPNQADPDSERRLLAVDQPQFNHEGGTVAFGPDGYLYLSLGDGGEADDVGEGHVEDWYEENEGGNGQDITENLLGSILRLDVDVDGEDLYAIPDDNPFVGETEGLDEIYAYGFRNPYRFSFDRGGENQLFVGDAGQNLYEEVSIVEAGGNYGWNVKEGTHCFSTETPDEPPASCPDEDPEGNALIDPIIEYSHEEVGLVVVGGYVYRGEALPELESRYLFGDWSTAFDTPDGSLYVATPPDAEGGMWDWEVLELTGREEGLGHFLLGFGEDDEGELYVLTSDSTGPTGNTGRVYQLVPASEADAEEMATPAATGTEAPAQTTTPAATLTPGATGTMTATLTPGAEGTVTTMLTPGATGTVTATLTPAGEGTLIEVQEAEFTITMPTSLAAGPLTFEVTNGGTMEHNFEVEGNGIEEVFESNLMPGETRTMPLELAAGTYEVYCPIGDHADRGMRVELTITD